LLSVFYDVENGFYIDIGANDPNVISVTKNLYIRGWNGINIEPLPDKYQALVKFRNKDINLQLGVGKIKENATLYLSGFGSTLQKNKKKNVKSIAINVDTMFNICRNYVPKNKIIQFCKIDVEGGERGVLLGYDFKRYKPKVFCVESTIPLSFKPNYQLWEEILIKNGFTFVYERGVNRYYVNKKFSDILNRANNIRDYFRKAHVRRYK
jgi:FkbM family methyltransferase